MVEAGSLVGRVIGSPVSLDMIKVDGGAPPTSSRPPQKPATMGGAGAPPAMNRPSYNPSGIVAMVIAINYSTVAIAMSSEPPKPSFGGSSYNPAPTQCGWGPKPYNGGAVTNK